MTNLKNILDLMPYATLDFSYDAFIQIVDYDTEAHYRQDGENILLGGNPVLCSMEQFMKLPVRCIEYIDDHCVISIGGKEEWA